MLSALTREAWLSRQRPGGAPEAEGTLPCGPRGLLLRHLQVLSAPKDNGEQNLKSEKALSVAE